MKISIASDHHGYKLKEKIKKYLEKKGYEVIDFGPKNPEPVDYPIYAKKVGYSVASNESKYGILICATGIGMSIACNRIRNVRCAHVSNISDVIHTRQDNDANVLAFGSDLKLYKVYDFIDAFLSTKFSNLERHKRRIAEIDLND